MTSSKVVQKYIDGGWLTISSHVTIEEAMQKYVKMKRKDPETSYRMCEVALIQTQLYIAEKDRGVL